MPTPPLPIDAVLPALRDALAARTAVVLEAPPGAGKTTRVPLALRDAPWLGGRKIVMLEPRRVAARAAARFMAAQLGEAAGETVGYRVRLDTQVSARTRIEVVTEGVLARMLRDDPASEETGLVVFDEFHERSLHADLGLALTLETQGVLRDDLRVLVMSATLDGARVAALLGEAPVVRSEGRAFPVTLRHAPTRPGARELVPAVAAAVRQALAETAGDLLAFLPGAGEIARVAQALAPGGGAGLGAGVRVLPLHGALPPAAQDDALRPDAAGRRKVVLATAIAETSLTLDGVRVVVDAGLARVPRFSPRTGMTRLATVRASRAATEQRAGRAGRQAPGTCYRLWPEAEQAGLVPYLAPEILEADLAPLALTLAETGVADAAALRWLDAPPAPALAQARALLRQLGALDAAGRITPHGRAMAALPVHPRLAHLLLRARDLGAGALACELAALLEERDLLRGRGAPPDADLRLRVELLRERGTPAAWHGADVAREGLRRARAEAAQLRRLLRVAAGSGDPHDTGLLLAFAYPDRIAQRRPGSETRFLLRNGRGAALAAPQALGRSDYVVAAELDDAGGESRIFLAAPVELAQLEAHAADQLETAEEVAWDEATGAVRARRVTRIGALELRAAPVATPDPAALTAALLAVVRREGLGALPWRDAALTLRQRVAFLRTLDSAWPDWGDAALLASLEAWLAPHLAGARRRDDLARLDLHDILLAALPWDRRAALDRDAPTHVAVPTGSRIAVDYADPTAPVLAVRLQELFGCEETPRVGGGRVPLTLHLLSPARRPVQVTRDLAGFWRTSYFDVRKDLRGRYPRHHWPENPLEAEPTRRAKPRGT